MFSDIQHFDVTSKFYDVIKSSKMSGLIRNFLRRYFLSKGSSMQNLKSIGVVEQNIIPAGSKGGGANHRTLVGHVTSKLVIFGIK